MAIDKITTPAIADDAVTNAKVSYNNNPFRNLIINGDMSIAQRGTSFTGAEYTLDRWRQSLSGGTATVTQETFSVGSEIALCKNYLRQDVSTGDNYLGILHRVEGVRSVKSGGSVTFSFYAKGTNPAGGGLNFHVEQRFGTGGSPSSDVVVYDSDTDIVLTSDWTRYTITFTFTDYTGKTFGTNNDDYIQIEIRQKGSDTSTNAWTLDLTGVQLEAGTTASDFEFLPYDVNLQRCLRYYQNIVSGDTEPFGNGFYYTSTFIFRSASFPVEMRTVPSLEQNSGTNYYEIVRNGGTDGFDDLALNSRTTNKYFEISNNTDVSGTAGHAGLLRGANANSFISFDAEL